MKTAWLKELSDKQAAGDAVEFIVLQGRKALKCLMIKSDFEDMLEHSAYDVAAALTAKGLARIFLRPEREIDYRQLLVLLRVDEARKMKMPFDKINRQQLASAAAHPFIKAWQFNQEQSVIENLKPTLLASAEIKHDLELGLGLYGESAVCPLKTCSAKRCSWQAYSLIRQLMNQDAVRAKKRQPRNQQLSFAQKWSDVKEPVMTKTLPVELTNQEFTQSAKFILK
ncbi:MAG: hypothetical protein UV78_C0045G0022 [Parcubacteria group bacterium GW2011_GWA2_43_17]|nr:MAG: hypothetical protein UV78_C0045G0022 [Parcubacteria group bacterium GW2011_GWA2_43_17]KKT98750.1 MAG: hypothetical protein UW98_C0004G0021 [Parcubacteria group bacterium GW2011_GWC2_45_15]OGY93651.1 MAG: hypothetical protein A2260_03250 [Candidatus Komeilibacteria bacterium RIFOXYA2_FULL_45_9]OGY95650.1 MAG: hypothetical protein A3J95_02645 [Candidatus Komeilibacteria bacterium RIFOXYC2_FULL_45_12]HAH04380.1 hypothetical protein [Candidatus Komeilibacteria bacterium]